MAVDQGDANLQNEFAFSHVNSSTSAITGTVSGLSIGTTYTLVVYASLGNSSNDGALINLTDATTAEAATMGNSTEIGSNGSIGLGTAYQEFTFDALDNTLGLRLTPNLQQTSNGNGAALYSVLQGIQIEAVPEPSTYALLAAGMGGLCLFQRARRRA